MRGTRSKNRLWENSVMSTEHPDDIVRLATAPNPMQAHIWEQVLNEEGIRCKVVGDYLDAGLGDIPGMSAEVWVHRDDLARAEAVLREHQPEASDESDEADEGDEGPEEPDESSTE